MTRICLSMIVKNEMANLERCLSSVAPYIDRWVICDTGSTDETWSFIQAFMYSRGIQGLVYGIEFENFSQARNVALERAEHAGCDYTLLVDADMELVPEHVRWAAHLDAPGYQILQRSQGVEYWNTRLVKRGIGARYHGVTHEYIDVPGGVEQLHGVWFKDHASGSNRPGKFQRDIDLLEDALVEEPNNSRYVFYLAQSYRDLGNQEKAKELYLKRARMGGWVEEVYMSCYYAEEYVWASTILPKRAESYHGEAKKMRLKGNYESAYRVAKLALHLKPYPGALFLTTWIYSYGLLDEFSVAAYWFGKYHESWLAAKLALSRGHPDKERLEANIRFAEEKMG